MRTNGRTGGRNVEGSCEYIEKSHGQPTRGGPAWGLGEELKTPHREQWHFLLKGYMYLGVE